MMTRFFMAALAAVALGLSGCQSLPNTKYTKDAQSDALEFDVTGKISVTYVDPQSLELSRSSAFYGWGQRGAHYAIELSGALGLGFTQIQGGPEGARMSSEKFGDASADTPEALLEQTTGWRAPLSALPYWVVAQADPKATQSLSSNQGQLTSVQSGAWHAELFYKAGESLPYLIKAKDTSPGSQSAVAISIQTRGAL